MSELFLSIDITIDAVTNVLTATSALSELMMDCSILIYYPWLIEFEMGTRTAK